MPAEPNEYRLGTSDPVMLFELNVTSWCNYECAYCVTTVHKTRGESKHMFDHHKVEKWIDAFANVPRDFALLCRGGEPFLDHENFARFLAGVGALAKLRYLRVDTNGSWDPARYDSVPESVRAATQLNVSFHPTQISLERFEKRLDKIIDAGWNVGMINFVMEAGQAAEYEVMRDHFQRTRGIFVNANPDAFDPAWRVADMQQAELARRPLVALMPIADIVRKTGISPRGRECFFPAISYMIGPNGAAQRSCGVALGGEKRGLDFIRDSKKVKAAAAPVKCPLGVCLCLDRYAFLEELPDRGARLNLLAEYVDACRAQQAKIASAPGARAKRVWNAIASVFSAPAPKKPAEAQPRRLRVLPDDPAA